MTKNRTLFLTIFVILLCCLMVSGCIQTKSWTNSLGNSLSGAIVTEHTYLYGDDGFFTERYDLTCFTVNTPKDFKDLSSTQLMAYLKMYNIYGFIAVGHVDILSDEGFFATKYNLIIVSSTESVEYKDLSLTQYQKYANMYGFSTTPTE